ncbi:hypothetical protein IQ238_03420 [Pleurocapsales cyanobacterium LEGE 06147]|nr:hypothetical protein [Pleurocapsales cyanobacterium LEGE 06147]
MSDVSSLVSGTFILGSLFGLGISWLLSAKSDRYEKLLRETKYLVNSKDGIVTVSDLVFNAGIPPAKCKKFIERLAIQLDAEVELTETGKIFYKFPTANNLDYKHLKGN